MKKQTILIMLFITLLTTFSSCEVVGGIFKAGMGTGIFIVLAIIAIIIFAISRMGKK